MRNSSLIRILILVCFLLLTRAEFLQQQEWSLQKNSSTGEGGGNWTIPKIPNGLLHRIEVSERAIKQSESFGNFYRSLPRYNLKFQEVSNTFNPTSVDYDEGVAMLAIPLAVAGVLVVLASIIWCGVSCCCGGPTSCRCCCQCEEKSGGDRCRVIFVCLLSAVLLGFAGYLLWAFIEFNEGVGSSIHYVQLSVDWSAETLNEAVDSAVSVGLKPSSQLQSFVSAMDSAKKYTNEATNILSNVRIGLLVLCFTMLALLLVVLLVAIILALINRHKGVGVVIVVLFVWSALAFFLAAPLLAANVMTADGCPVAPQYIASQLSGQNQGYLYYYLFCNTSAIQNDPLYATQQQVQSKLLEAQAQLTALQLSCPNCTQQIAQLQSQVSQLNTTLIIVLTASNCSITSVGFVNTHTLFCIEMFDQVFFAVNALTAIAVFAIPLLALLCLQRSPSSELDVEYRQQYISIPDVVLNPKVQVDDHLYLLIQRPPEYEQPYS